MSDNTKVVLIGYSGHGYVLAEAALEASVNVCYYAEKSIVTKNPFNLIFIGSEDSEKFDGFGKGFGFIVGIGDNIVRRKISENLRKSQEKLISVIHPHASVSVNAAIGLGVFISRNAAINALAKIGDFAIINTGSIVEHECVVGNSVHIAPGAVLAGNVSVGDCSFIGANAVIKQGVVIGKNVIVGAGAVIIKNIPDNSVIVGNPGNKK